MKFSIKLFLILIIYFIQINNIKSQNYLSKLHRINLIIDTNYTKNEIWKNKPIFKIEKDSLIIIYSSSHHFGILLKNVICVNQLAIERYKKVLFYHKENNQNDAFAYTLKFEKSDSIETLINLFNSIYVDLKLKVPSNTCMWYENDKMAQIFEPKFKYFMNNDYIHAVYGIDSNYTGVIKFNYVNGNRRFERKFISGILVGIQKEYNDDGILTFEGNYMNGQPEGKLLYYDDSGKIAIERNFKDGAEHGKTISYWENGKINFIQIFENGILKEEKYWDEEGKPQE